MMPSVVHIHGKFYGFDANGDELSVDYAALMRVFHEAGYDGFMSSEWKAMHTPTNFEVSQWSSNIKSCAGNTGVFEAKRNIKTKGKLCKKS